MARKEAGGEKEGAPGGICASMVLNTYFPGSAYLTANAVGALIRQWFDKPSAEKFVEQSDRMRRDFLILHRLF